MACYSYKRVCHNIPQHITDEFIKINDREPDGDPDYNGDCWILAGMWIDELLSENKLLKSMVEQDVRQ